MTIVSSDYEYVFDSVQFGIDVREARRALELTQEQLANYLGHKTPTRISAVETAQRDHEMKLSDFVKLCNILNLKPSFYWDVHPVDGSTMTEIPY